MTIKNALLISLLINLNLLCYAQSDAEYNSLKSTGALNENYLEALTVADPEIIELPVYQTSSLSILNNDNCGCWIEQDETFTIASPFQDDIGTWYAIPFEFKFYGSTYNDIHISPNGNITLENTVNSFTPEELPIANPIIAEFWADVYGSCADCGTLGVKSFDNALIINYKDVATYPGNGTTARNSFQVILSDGTSDLIGFGNNIGFCYKQLEWAHGIASNESAAVVGVSNGEDQFFQIGAFNVGLGDVYDGPFGEQDGLNWLIGRGIYFNVETDNQGMSIVPLASTICDPYEVCLEGTTLNFEFIPPDPTVTLSYEFNGEGAVLVNEVNVISGAVSELSIQITPELDMYGMTIPLEITASHSSGVGASSSYLFNLLITAGENCIAQAGCADSNACNFDPLALVSDGSCTYPEFSFLNCEGDCINDSDNDGICDEIEISGCLDPDACNFDENATDEDESLCYYASEVFDCEMNCLQDQDGDGICDQLEGIVQQFCGEGTIWDPVSLSCVTVNICLGDVDGNGVIAAGDLAMLLAAFGELVGSEYKTDYRFSSHSLESTC